MYTMDLQPQQPFYQKPTKQQMRTKILAAIQTLSKISPSSQQVKQSNNIIINLLHQPQSLELLITLLISCGENQTYCNLIVSFINYYIKMQVRPGVGITRKNKKHICDKIKNVFFCQTVSDKSKRLLLKGFQQFLGTLSPQFINIRKQLCSEIVKFFTTQQTIRPVDLDNMLYIIQAIVTNNLQSQTLRTLQQSLLLRFINLSLDLLRNLNKQLSQITNPILNTELAQKLIWAQKIMKITSLLFISANIDKLVVLKNAIIKSPNLANMCIQSLKMLSKTEQKRHIINNTQCNKYQCINSIKCQSLKIVVDYLKILIKGRRNLSDPKYIPVTQTIKQFLTYIPILATQIQGYPTKKTQSQQLFKQTLLVLASTSTIPCLLDQHTKIRDIVLFKLCLPCLMTTPQDRQLAAEDFCQKKQNIINFQQAMNIHQTAVSLIQSYADQIYGTIPYLVKSMIGLMDFQLTADPRHYQNIPVALIQTQFFKNHTYFQQFQVGLSVLAILSYHADRRDDLSTNIEQFIVRRQQFFSRIDVPEQFLVSFLHFCSFYLQNFYQLILQGKANANFHRSLIIHALQLLNISVNKDTKKFVNNNTKKVGIQAIDYLSNCVIQPYFFSAIFPAWNQKSSEMLIGLMDRICLYFAYSCNVLVLQNIVIHFVTTCIDRHHKQNNNYTQMPQVLRNQLSILFVNKIIQNFTQKIHNQTIAKQKMLELYSLILVYCKNPHQIFQLGLQLFQHITQKQYSFIDQLIDILQIYLHRSTKQPQPTKQLLTTPIKKSLIKCLTKSMKICDDEKFQNQIFDIVLNTNILQIGQQQIVDCLMQIFLERLEERDTEQQAQIVMEKCLYLVMQVAFSNFQLVSGNTWIQVLQHMIEYLKNNYKSNDTIIVGKATAICLCCYIQNPQGIENLLKNQMEGLWDCILDDHLKYDTHTQKKIVSIILLNLMTKYSQKQSIKDKFPSILKSVCLIMYYIYQKNQMSWNQQQSQSQSQQNKSKSQNQKDKDKKLWKQPLNKMRDNLFLKSLPDERALLKNICVSLNQTNHQSFNKFVQDLPIGLQNFVKNKVVMYREDPVMVNKKKMRTIYKVRKVQQDQDI